MPEVNPKGKTQSKQTQVQNLLIERVPSPTRVGDQIFTLISPFEFVLDHAIMSYFSWKNASAQSSQKKQKKIISKIFTSQKRNSQRNEPSEHTDQSYLETRSHSIKKLKLIMRVNLLQMRKAIFLLSLPCGDFTCKDA